MGYTRVWNKADVPGTTAAKLIDDKFRDFKEDIEERMSTLVTGWSTSSPTDPIVPLPIFGGPVSGKTIEIGHQQFVMSGSGVVYSRTNLSTVVTATNPTDVSIFAPFVLGIGSVLTQLTIKTNQDSAAKSISFDIGYAKDDNSPVSYTSIVAASLAAQTGYQSNAYNLLNYVHARGRNLILQVNLPSPIGVGTSIHYTIYGFEILYNSPSNSTVL